MANWIKPVTKNFNTYFVTITVREKTRIRSYSGHYFPYSVRMRENTDQNNSECGHF